MTYMVLYDDFNTWFESKITEQISSNYKNYDGTLNLVASYHSEYYYTQNAVVDFTLVFLPGPIQQETNNRPIQILCEVEEKYKDDFFEAMDKTALAYNESILTLDSKKYRVYFNTPAVTQKFVDYGATKRAILTMDASIIKYDNVLNISTFYLSADNKNFTQIKFSSFALAYMVDTNNTGAVDSSLSLSVGETAACNITISFVPKADDICTTLLDLMFKCTSANKKFYLKITTGNGTEIPLTTIISSGGLTNETQSFPIMQLTFVRAA